MFPYGTPTTTEANVYECLGCECTYTAREWELKRDGWELHRVSDGSTVVVCPECKETFAERKRMREALAKGAE